MQASTILIVDAIILAAGAAIFGKRLIKNYHRKAETPDAYMIKNVDSGLVIRPQDAKIEDGIPIIQYNPQNWECTTWQMIGIGDNKYLLKDLYTQKSFAPVGGATNGSLLEQRPIGNDEQQHWIFNLKANGKYTIQLAGTKLYITSSSKTVNDRLSLQYQNQLDNQLWTLHQQQPII